MTTAPAGRRARDRTSETEDLGGMDYLVSVPRKLVTVWIPLAIFLFVLLLPFYWMTITSLKSNEELYDYENFSPFWVVRPTLDNIERLMFETSYPSWLIPAAFWNPPYCKDNLIGC